MTSNRVAAGTDIGGSAANQLNGPIGIFVDVNLDLYVADCFNNRIQLSHPGESYGITVAGNGSLNPTITLYIPSGIILDADKYLFIVDCFGHRIVGSDLNGFRCLAACYGSGSQSNQLFSPLSFSFDRSGNIFVADQGNSRIQKFLLMKDSFAESCNQPKLCSTATWNSNAVTFANQSIVGSKPRAIFVNTNNTIYVANREENTILIWHEESVNPTKITHDNFTQPNSLFVTSNNDIYIDDGEKNGRVQKWIAETNNFVTVMNVKSSCWGLSVDINNTLYCSMLQHHQVVKRSLNNSLMVSDCVAAGTGIGGPDSNQFFFPHGIFVDVNLDLYVTDCLNERVQLFQLRESNGITVAGSKSQNPTITLDCPTGIILDADKYLFIVDQDSSRIVRSDLNGFRCLLGCYGSGSQSNQLFGPLSLSFDRFGNVFVLDQDNHRIQKFKYFEESCDNSLLLTKSTYSSSLTPNSSIYFQDCSELDSYYEALQMNVNITGYYTFLINSEMKTMYAYTYTNNFNPFHVSKNVLSYSGDFGNQGQLKLTAVLEANMKYVLVMTTSSSNVTANVSIYGSGRGYIAFNRILNTSSVVQTTYASNLTTNSSTYLLRCSETGASSIFVSGPNNVDLKNINSPSVTQIPYSSNAQSNYSSELNTSSQTYSRDCRKSNYYYQTIRVNVLETGYYALSSDSSMDTFGDIYEDDFDSMSPFENLLSQNYRSCSFQGFKFIAYLHTGTTYILVVTTFSPNMTGSFSILTSGPNNITLDPYSKYFLLFVNHQQRITIFH
ncbi:unnamed protein product [Adineta steineri]|uniref:NHL repeat containing protein-like protein n=1 Tax=Adineta steineri TaxID=433720 RepID=A0A818T6F7_9BILA|nr:unnamed protein product [Adineta steineri]